MGQQEIIEYLKSSKYPMTRKEIAKGLNIDECKVSKIIERLVSFDEVSVIELHRLVAMKFYKVKRKLRLFYI